MTQIQAAARPKTSLTLWIRRHPVLSLIVLIPGAMDELGLLPFHLPQILGLVAGWGPALAAVIVIGALQGRAGVKNLFRRYLIWRVSIGWYLIALFGTAIFILGGIGLHVLLGGKVPTLPVAGIPLVQAVIVFLISIVFGFVANTEDVAWRGVALPLLQGRHGALIASLIIVRRIDPPAILFHSRRFPAAGRRVVHGLYHRHRDPDDLDVQ